MLRQLRLRTTSGAELNDSLWTRASKGGPAEATALLANDAHRALQASVSPIIRIGFVAWVSAEQPGKAGQSDQANPTEIVIRRAAAVVGITIRVRVARQGRAAARLVR